MIDYRCSIVKCDFIQFEHPVFQVLFSSFFFFTKSEEADEDENLKNNLKMRDES